MQLSLFIRDLDISGIRHKGDISIHSSKSTANTLQNRKQESKRECGPKMHPDLTPIPGGRQPPPYGSGHLKRNLQQHPRHHMKPDKVGPLFSSNNCQIRDYEIRDQEPARQAPEGAQKRVSQELEIFEKRVKVIRGFCVHPCFMERHQVRQAC